MVPLQVVLAVAALAAARHAVEARRCAEVEHRLQFGRAMPPKMFDGVDVHPVVQHDLQESVPGEFTSNAYRNRPAADDVTHLTVVCMPRRYALRSVTNTRSTTRLRPPVPALPTSFMNASAMWASRVSSRFSRLALRHSRSVSVRRAGSRTAPRRRAAVRRSRRCCPSGSSSAGPCAPTLLAMQLVAVDPLLSAFRLAFTAPSVFFRAISNNSASCSGADAISPACAADTSPFSIACSVAEPGSTESTVSRVVRAAACSSIHPRAAKKSAGRSRTCPQSAARRAACRAVAAHVFATRAEPFRKRRGRRTRMHHGIEDRKLADRTRQRALPSRTPNAPSTQRQR